ncbi:hypothetical protein [Bacteroides sp.]|uniref:hypothetical protein n=1 Tax=Bacteroides sp. TaxID=29523 RepID=UPI0025B8BA8C|nr:hypothetical protein [Bacteroides sp.]
MKIITFCWAIFITLFLILSCSNEPKHVSEGRKFYELYFNKKLKDPESFKVYDENYKNLGNVIVWTLDYGARNSLGGMIRETVEIRTYNNKLEIDGYEYTKDDLK